MRNRWYAPRLGQFISHDPLEYVDSSNLYAFASFDPINNWDPLGLEPKPLGGKAAADAEAIAKAKACERDPGSCEPAPASKDETPESDTVAPDGGCDAFFSFSRCGMNEALTESNFVNEGTSNEFDSEAIAEQKERLEGTKKLATASGVVASLMLPGPEDLVVGAFALSWLRTTIIAPAAGLARLAGRGAAEAVSKLRARLAFKRSARSTALPHNVANAIRLRHQLASQEIANGHAFIKHVIEPGEFADLGIRTPSQFASHIENIMNNPSATRSLREGRTAFWDDATGTVVIRNPRAADGGTAFRPVDGRAYFEGL